MSFTARRGDRLCRKVNNQPVTRIGLDFGKQYIYSICGQHDRQHAILEAVVIKNICETRCYHRAEAEILQSPGRVFPTGTTAEIFASQQDRSALVTRLIKHKIRIQLTL